MNDISRDNNTHDVYIYHNTIINCKHAVRLNTGQSGSVNTKNVIVQNNRSNGSDFEGTQVDHNRSDMHDKGYVDPRNKNYRLKPTSMSIDAGIAIPGINDDAVGAPDLGAYEFNGQDWTTGASIKVPDFSEEKKG